AADPRLSSRDDRRRSVPGVVAPWHRASGRTTHRRAPGAPTKESTMTFTNPQGTRGAHQPRGRFLAGRNRRVARRAGRSTGDLLALTTIGRKTGQERSTPVGGFPGGNGSWIVVASAAGARANPAWYLNLAAHP